MRTKYALRYLPVAQDDLTSIFDYIAQDNTDKALSFVKKVHKWITSFSQPDRTSVRCTFT